MDDDTAGTLLLTKYLLDFLGEAPVSGCISIVRLNVILIYLVSQLPLYKSRMSMQLQG